MEVVDRRYPLSEVLHNVEFNQFLDGIMGCFEVVRITLADNLLQEGWDDCDLDIDIEIKGGRGSKKLSEFLSNYRKVNYLKVRDKQTGEWEIAGHHGSFFSVVGPYYLEISWGHKPYTVPYMVLRERGLRKKKWLQDLSSK